MRTRGVRNFLAAIGVGLLLVVGVAGFSPEEIAAFEKAKVGDTIAVSEPAGDGCNTCTVFYLKVSETMVRRQNALLCTLLSCGIAAPVRFK